MLQRFRPLAASIRSQARVAAVAPFLTTAAAANSLSPRFYSTPAPATPPETSAEGSGLSSSAPSSESLPPYFVPRTAGGELPVYSDIRNGGSRVYTIVRKTRGDLAALQRDLASYLTDVPSHIKPSAGQVVLRGDWVRETKEWLAAKGF